MLVKKSLESFTRFATILALGTYAEKERSLDALEKEAQRLLYSGKLAVIIRDLQRYNRIAESGQICGIEDDMAVLGASQKPLAHGGEATKLLARE